MPKSYEVFVARAVLKELKKLGPSVASEIFRQIRKKLTSDPAQYGEALHGDLGGYLKLRVSGFRVVYRIEEERVWVLVLAVGKRNAGNVDNIYDWLSSDLLRERLRALLKEIKEGQDDDPE